MDAVGLYANLTSKGAPISNGVVAVEVDYANSSSWTPILLRSLRGVSNPSGFDNNLRVLITPVNINWVPQTGFETGTEAYFNVTLVNSGSAVTGILAWSVLDAASVPLEADAYGSPGAPNTFNPGVDTVLASAGIPLWAALGTATVYVNLFTNAPKVGGFPLMNETSCGFQITSSYGPSAKTIGSVESQSLGYRSTSTDPSGLYNFSYRVPPYPAFGTYVAYAAALNTTPTYSATTFQVKQAALAPHASYTYNPSAPYVNGTVYFDASGSYSTNGTITNYAWNWGDGSPKQSTSSVDITHVFKAQGTYTVTLNVTDSQNLWGIDSEPVSVSGPTPPVASFTFTPDPTYINATTKFNATGSTPGWNGTGNPPIVSYIWNFGDGTPVTTTSSTTTSHKFTVMGNFTTTLTVKDTRGMNGTTTQKVQVKNPSSFYPLVNIIITGVGFASPPKGLYKIAPNYYQPYRGWAGNVSVTVLNNGTTTESFTVSLICSNGTFSQPLGTQSVTKLTFLDSTVLTYSWNTSQLEPTMNYTITANTSSISGETNPQNEQYSITARVKGPGDINGDGVVDLLDLTILTGNWLKKIPPGNPLADPEGIGKVDLLDLTFVTGNWLKTYHG
jgi:PKD repeat protein